MGLTDWLQTTKNITGCQQNEKKTADGKEINRQPKWYFVLLFISLFCQTYFA